MGHQGVTHDAGRQSLIVSLFGPFSVREAEGRDLTPAGRKARALLAMLALAPNGRRSRAWLQDRLWSEKSQHLGRASLRHELSDLRRRFLENGHQILAAHGDDVVLDLSVIKTDIEGPPPPSHHELLEGMDIDDPEFEYWLSEERAYWYDKFSSSSKQAESTQPSESKKERPRRLVPHLSLQALKVIGKNDEVAAFTQGLDTEISAMFGAFVGGYFLIDQGFQSESAADYVLTGTVRSGKLLRVAVQAIHAPDGGVVWSDKFDVPDKADFDVQERIARQIVESVQRVLSDGARARHRAGDSTSTKAWELYQKGRALEARGGPRRLAPSLEYYRSAVEIDPGFLTARIALAFRLLDGLRNCWIDDREATRAEARRITSDIVATDPENLWGQALSAFMACADGRFDEGRRTMEDVVRQTPESPEITSCLGAIYDYCGDNLKGVSMHRHALTLTAFPPIWIRNNLALSLLLMREPAALRASEEVLEGDPENVRAMMVKAISLFRSRQLDEAQSVAKTIRLLDPRFTAERWRSPDFFFDVRQYDQIRSELAQIGF